MKEWLTCREIAAEALPDLPATERGVQAMAEREKWGESLAYARRREGRGGGTEFHIALLPTTARLAYERRHRRIEAPAPAPTGAAGPAPATDTAARERDARLAVLQAFESFCRGAGLGQASAMRIFCDRYNCRSMAVDPWILAAVGRISPRSLARWKAEREAGRTDKLAVRRDHRKGKGLLDVAEGGRVRVFVLALIAHNEHLPAAEIIRQIRFEFGDLLNVERGGTVKREPVPPLRTVQLFVAGLKETEHVALTKLSNPDFYRGSMAPAGVGSHRWVEAPNQVWQIDASPVDALCTDGRWSIYACIDIGTRRSLFLMSRTPRAASVALLIRKAILAWGVPMTIKTDNGSDFRAEDTQRLFAALGIEADVSDAYSPQQKGHVERVIRTFQHQCSNLMPGFVGHNVADRKRIEDRKSFADRLGEATADTFGVQLTGAEMQRLVDEWVDLRYQHSPHAGLKGQSPFAVAAASPAVIRRVDERALDILLMPVAGKDGQRQVTKLGIRIGGYHYVINECESGDRVFVRMDPLDMGRAYVFAAAAGSYIGLAVCPELAGLHPATVMAAKREAHAEIMADRTKAAREEIRRLTQGPSLIERSLEIARRDQPNVVALPKRSEEHTTPQIEAALAAAGEAPAEPVDTAADAPDTTRTAEVVAFAPREPRPGERPRFASDVDYAGWLLANPDALAPHDVAHLKDRLASWAFRQLLTAAGVDPAAVKTLLDKPPQTLEASS